MLTKAEETRSKSIGRIGAILILKAMGPWTLPYCLHTIAGVEMNRAANIIFGLAFGQYIIGVALITWITTFFTNSVPFIK